MYRIPKVVCLNGVDTLLEQCINRASPGDVITGVTFNMCFDIINMIKKCQGNDKISFLFDGNDTFILFSD
jgi:hypothetical protein